MPRLAPFILLATFLTHDNNFHLYLSRECEKKEHYITEPGFLEAAEYLGQGIRAAPAEQAGAKLGVVVGGAAFHPSAGHGMPPSSPGVPGRASG